MKNDRANIGSSQPRLLRYYEWGLAVGWTMVIALLLVIIFQHERSQAVETARTQARSNFQRDVIYRHWNAEVGAVYAPITGKIKPNPYLSGVPDRDIVTKDGRKLTLVNPSYMTRLVFDMAASRYGLKGHITSLRPIRPENRPDPWEERSLKAFSDGSQEESSLVKMGSDDYLRLMKPLRTEEECLKCHASQGYRVGEIRGGLSVAVPMKPLWDIAHQNFILTLISFIVLWAIGLAGIVLGAGRLRSTIRERDKAEREIVALNEDLLARTRELESANRELDAFCATVSHDLRTPLTVIGGYCQLLQNAPQETNLEKCNEYTAIIIGAVHRMEKLITTLLTFSRISRGELTRTMVDLSEVSKGLALELQLKEPQRCATFLIAPGMMVNADENLVQVVMQNLIGNAWKYSGKSVEARIEIGTVERDGKQVFFVRDNGIGFDNSKATKIFDAFHRLDNTDDFEGTGIGLATVKRIITRHGGQITCEGEAGKGATFYFSL